MRISYSSLDTYKTCPLKFKFQQLDKIRTPKNIEMIFGSAVHSALKYMFERTPLYPTLDEVIDFFRNKWDEQAAAIGDKPENEKDALREQGIALLKNFYKKNQPWNFNAVELESFFSAELEDPKTGEKHVLTGIMDRIDKNQDDDSYEIIDYKTAKKMPSQSVVDSDLQMSIYHLGIVKRWPHLASREIKLSLYFLKHGEKISTVRSKKQLEETAETVLEAIREIEGRMADNYDFPPHPSALCDWCGCRKMCPMWKHLYGGQPADSLNQKDIEPIIKEYFEIKEQNSKNKERMDELKTAILSFMDGQKVERVFGGEGYITRTVRESTSYDMAKVEEALKPAGKWEGILSADEKKLEKILASLPRDIQENILEARSIKRILTLTASKKTALKKKAETNKE